MKCFVLYPSVSRSCYVTFYTLNGMDKNFPIVGEFLRPSQEGNSFITTPMKWNKEGKACTYYSFDSTDYKSMYDFLPDSNFLELNSLVSFFK